MEMIYVSVHTEGSFVVYLPPQSIGGCSWVAGVGPFRRAISPKDMFRFESAEVAKAWLICNRQDYAGFNPIVVEWDRIGRHFEWVAELNGTGNIQGKQNENNKILS